MWFKSYHKSKFRNILNVLKWKQSLGGENVSAISCPKWCLPTLVWVGISHDTVVDLKLHNPKDAPSMMWILATTCFPRLMRLQMSCQIRLKFKTTKRCMWTVDRFCKPAFSALLQIHLEKECIENGVDICMKLVLVSSPHPAQHLSKIKRAPDMKYSLCSLADNFDKANKDIKLIWIDYKIF